MINLTCNISVYCLLCLTTSNFGSESACDHKASLSALRAGDPSPNIPWELQPFSYTRHVPSLVKAADAGLLESFACTSTESDCCAKEESRGDSWAAEGNGQLQPPRRASLQGGDAKPRSLRSAPRASISPANTLHFRGFLPSGPWHLSGRSRRGRTCQRPLAAAASAQRWPGTWEPAPSPEPSGRQQPAAERPEILGPAAAPPGDHSQDRRIPPAHHPAAGSAQPPGAMATALPLATTPAC